MVAGSGPQSNVMMPPCATALTTAADVHPDGEPVPILWVGWLVSIARASDGIVAWPDGLPGWGRSFGFLPTGGVGVADFDGAAEADTDGAAASKDGDDDGGGTKAGADLSAWCPQPPNRAATRVAVKIANRRSRTGRL
jgi:hypothetical protein